MALSPREMQAAIIRNLPERTGRTLAEWIAEVRTHGPATAARSLRAARTAWLKQQHHLGHVQAQIIAAHAEDAGGAYDDASALFAALFPPDTAGRAIVDALVQQLADAQLGAELVPCQTYVGLRSTNGAGLQFAVCKPARSASRTTPATEVIVGIALPAHADLGDPSAPVPGRARRGLGGSTRITHELVLRDVVGLDEAMPWIALAHGVAST